MGGERIRVTSDEPLRRRRLAVLFRVLLFVPQYIVLSLWSLFAAAALKQLLKTQHTDLAEFYRDQAGEYAKLEADLEPERS